MKLSLFSLGLPLLLSTLIPAQAAPSVASSFKLCKLNWLQTSSGVSLVSHSFSDPKQSQAPAFGAPLTLDTTIKLACTLDNSLPIHHAALIFDDSYTLPLRIRKVKENYSIKLDLDLSKASADFLRLKGKVDYGLYIASFAAGEQLVAPLGQLEFAPQVRETIDAEEREKEKTYPSEWEVDRYRPRELKEWTERKPVEGRSLGYGVVGSIVVIGSPLIVLVFLLSQVIPTLPINTSLYTTQTSLFLATLVALDGLILAYWIKVKLFTILPYLALVGALSVYVGRGALRQRLASRIKASKSS